MEDEFSFSDTVPPSFDRGVVCPLSLLMDLFLFDDERRSHFVVMEFESLLIRSMSIFVFNLK